MSKNPFVNAILAIGYICIVASVMFYGTEHSSPVKSVVVPIAMLSLFTLSALVMGFIFGSEPLQLYLDGKKKEAVRLFLQTVAVFAAVTIVLLAILFSGVLV